MKITKLALILSGIGSAGATNFFIKGLSSSGKNYKSEEIKDEKPKIGGQFSWRIVKNEQNQENRENYQMAGLRYHGPTAGDNKQKLWLSEKGLEELREIWRGEECIQEQAKNDDKHVSDTLLEAINSKTTKKCSLELNKALIKGIRKGKWSWYYSK